MKYHPWTIALMSAGLVSLPAVILAEEKPSSVLTGLSSTTLSGYVDTSAQWNFGTGDANLPPYAFGGSAKADGFNLNVVRLLLEKPIDTAADAWSAGYKVDLIFGPDADSLATQSSGTAADFGIKQAYVALHAPVGNGVDFKLGVWDTLMGYEVFQSGDNPNFTRSYGYTMEPTTHTGLSMSYNFSEVFSATVGVVDTFGSKINERAFAPPQTSPNAQAESFKSYMGTFTITAPTTMGFLAGSTLSACVMNGFNSGVGSPSGIGNNQTSYYVGSTVNTPIKGLKAGCAFDALSVHDASGETWAVGGYLSYQATEKLSFHGRAEYVRDRGDQKFFAVRNSDGAILADTAPDKFMEMTLTAQYDLWKNVISRLELRWDHSLSGLGVWGGTVSNLDEGGNGDQINAVMLAANIIYKF
jgi:hypothetical protein